MAWAQAYLHAKFHLDQSNRLAEYTKVTDRQVIQRSDNVGRTVLQTVAQTRFTHAQSDNGWVDFSQILHIDSLGGRSDIFETVSKLVQGFGRIGVRIFAYPIDSSIGF